MDLEPIYTPIEVAEILKVKPRTLEDWRSDGKGPKFFRMGSLVRYKQSAIEDYIAAAEKKSE